MTMCSLLFFGSEGDERNQAQGGPGFFIVIKKSQLIKIRFKKLIKNIFRHDANHSRG